MKKWIQIKRACVVTWGRPINGRMHNEKSTRMHRHAGLWHHPHSRLSARPVGNLSDGHLLAGIRPRRIRRNSVSPDNHKSAITFGNKTVARDGKFVVRERAFQPIRRVANLPDGHLFAGIRARGGGQWALESSVTKSREGESRLKK